MFICFLSLSVSIQVSDAYVNILSVIVFLALLQITVLYNNHLFLWYLYVNCSFFILSHGNIFYHNTIP
jgi:hypothetical protein